MTIDKGKLEFLSKLKGKRHGGELHNWVLREVPDPKTGEILGHLAYGWKNGRQTWRTSAVLEVLDMDDGQKMIETRNTYYTLVGEEATEEQKEALYREIF